jgi:hypothetical protein
MQPLEGFMKGSCRQLGSRKCREAAESPPRRIQLSQEHAGEAMKHADAVRENPRVLKFTPNIYVIHSSTFNKVSLPLHFPAWCPPACHTGVLAQTTQFAGLARRSIALAAFVAQLAETLPPIKFCIS